MKRPGDTIATFGTSATDAHFTNSKHITTFQAPLVEISTENERPRRFSIRRQGAAYQTRLRMEATFAQIERRPVSAGTRPREGSTVRPSIGSRQLTGGKPRREPPKGEAGSRHARGWMPSAGRERRSPDSRECRPADTMQTGRAIHSAMSRRRGIVNDGRLPAGVCEDRTVGHRIGDAVRGHKSEGCGLDAGAVAEYP